MKNAIEKLNEKYNINIHIERHRYDVYDHRGGYYTEMWCRVNGITVCVRKHKGRDLNKVLTELENQIIDALN